METQKNSNRQSNNEKEEWNCRNPPFWLQTILQSYSHQDSMVLVQRQKYRSMEQNSLEINPHTHRHLIFDKGGKVYSREKTIFLTSGSGKTGQPCVKE